MLADHLHHPVLGLCTVPVGYSVAQFFKLNSIIFQRIHRIFRPDNGILMPRLSFQHYILNLPVPVAVHPAIRMYQLRRQFTLHHPRLLRIRPHIIKLFPLHHILCNRFPVKKYDRHIIFPCQINDLRGVGPIHQIDAQYIAPLIYQRLHLIVLGALGAYRIPDRHRCLHSISRKSIQLFFETVNQFPDKHVAAIVTCHSHIDLIRRGRLLTAGGKQKRS